VIVVTGQADDRYRRASPEAGADDFLDKADLDRLPALLSDKDGIEDGPPPGEGATRIRISADLPGS
jgi:hypothetical protein